jgi:tripartite-type tricarboxylate transporter receptor subunit TctC
MIGDRGPRMEIPRRRFLHLAAGAVMLPAVSRAASAQTYPSRPVRLVVGFAAGGGSDILARLMGQRLSERLGQPFIIENRTGAGSNIAAETVVNATADGHTLLLVTTANAVNATLYDKLSFNFARDIVPVAGLLRVPNVMLIDPSVPANSVTEFIAYAKLNPTKVNMGSGGNGGPVHMAGALFQMMSGVSLVHVPYRGEALALTDLLGGQVQVVFGSVPSSIGYIKGGKLRALAVTTATRSDALPDVPALADFVPGYEMSTWYGVGAPRNTPPDIVDKLNAEINAALADPKFRARLTDLSGTVLGGSSSDLGNLIAEETEKWAKVVTFAGIKPT